MVSLSYCVNWNEGLRNMIEWHEFGETQEGANIAVEFQGSEGYHPNLADHNLGSKP